MENVQKTIDTLTRHHCTTSRLHHSTTSRRHHTTTAAVLKVTEDIRLYMEDGQEMVLVLLDFFQAFDMVIYAILFICFLCFILPHRRALGT
jgi:hypothetical protein